MFAAKICEFVGIIARRIYIIQFFSSKIFDINKLLMVLCLFDKIVRKKC